MSRNKHKTRKSAIFPSPISSYSKISYNLYLLTLKSLNSLKSGCCFWFIFGHTVWIFKKFTVTQILREINLAENWSIYAKFSWMKYLKWPFMRFYICQNWIHVKSEWQKIVKFPHCGTLIYFWSFFRSKGCYRHYGKWRYLDFSLRHVVFIWRTLGHLRKWAIDWPWGKTISRPRNCKENYHPWHFETLWHSVKFWEMFPNYSVKCFRFLCHSDFTWNQFQIF